MVSATKQLDLYHVGDNVYDVAICGHKYPVRLVTREFNKKVVRILMAVSSSKWYRKSGRRWCSFAHLTNSGEIVVWDKFAHTTKRGRDWDALALAFRDQVLSRNCQTKGILQPCL